MGYDTQTPHRPVVPALECRPARADHTVNCVDQVRLWISSDGLPPKHQARLLRLRAMNPHSRITLIVSRRTLTTAAARALDAFGAALDLDIQDIGSIAPADADERLILEHINAEIDACFAAPETATGNLSVVSDYARLLDFVLRRGLCTDMDVEFVGPLSESAAHVPCPLGVLARFKRNGCVSNDATAGLAHSTPFRLARRNVVTLIRRYRAAACRYLADSGIHRATDPATVSAHPRFFELRNMQHDPALAGTARFSLAGGPDNVAISLHQAGIYCGYESNVERGYDPGELAVDHVPHVLTDATADRAGLRYEPYRFGPTRSDLQPTQQREQLWPPSLPGVLSHWDHSWLRGQHRWRALTRREDLLLSFFHSRHWSLTHAASLLGAEPLASCPVRPAPMSLIGPPAVAGAEVAVTRPTLAQALDPSRDEIRRGLESRLAGADGLRPSRQFVANGIVAVHGLIEAGVLDRLRAAFEIEVVRKTAGNALAQGAFNMSVDNCASATIELVREIAATPLLINIVEYYLGGLSRFVSVRGYRQGPCTPMRYRAWDYHQDMKTAGPFEEVKVMLLLTDVPSDGQAMRYACGTQAYRWDCRTQQQTKFTLDEALKLGRNGLFVGHGAAGTCVLFDTNGIHSGHRNLSVTRDVITMNFTPASPTAFFMFSHPVLTEQRCQASRSATAGRLAWRTSTATGHELALIRDEYRRTPVLADTRPRWNGDALDLVDVVVADLNVDLDLRLSRRFEDDRARDIGLVAIRDAGPHHTQYTNLLGHLDPRAPGEPRCLWRCPAPLAAVVDIAAAALDVVSTRLVGEEAENCAALLRDLTEAVVRCDSMQRLRTTTIFLYFAAAWASRQSIVAGFDGLDVGCSELLHFYRDLVAWDDRQELPEGDDTDE